MEQTVNSFQKGLQMDTHPMIQGNEVLSDALNATYITAQGNEIILQNDMGNRKIEEAFLPPGYVPVGVKEYGGIIYVASYNPLTNRGQLGSFPSPERTSLYNYDGQEINFGFDTFMEKGFCFLKEQSRIFTIYKDILHTGDKFTLFSVNELWSNPDYRNNISNFCNVTGDKVTSPKNKQYTLSVGILDQTNNFIDITKDLNRYNVKEDGTVEHLSKTGNEIFDFNNGYFLAEKTEGGLEDIVESYRKIVSEAGKGTLYKQKLNSPLCIKVQHNYPSKFEYTIKGKASSNKESIEKLTITATLEYNCPDNGIEKEGDFDDNYYNYFISSVEYCKFFDFQIIKNGEYIQMWPLSWEAIEESGFLTRISDKLNKLNQDNITKAKVKEILNEIIAFYPEDSTYTTYLEQLENSNDPLAPEEIKGSVSYSISEAYIRIVYNVDQSLLPKISHYINDKGEVVYKAEISRKYTKVVNYQEQTDITYNRINSNGEHIVDYFIGVPYSLIEQTNTCENPYIRSLSTFGEINIDQLNSDKFEIRKWIFTTSRQNEDSDWETSVEYEFNTGEEFTPFEIVLYDVNDLLHSTNTIQVRQANGSFEIIKESPTDEVLGKAYKVEFRRDGQSLLKEGQFYWILCTQLFNDKNNTSDLLYVGNNYVEPIDGIIKITTSNNVEKEINPKENQQKLLTVPINVLLESTLEDNDSITTLDVNSWPEGRYVFEEEQSSVIKTIEKQFTTEFNTTIKIGEAKIECNIDLYPNYVKELIKKINFNTSDIFENLTDNNKYEIENSTNVTLQPVSNDDNLKDVEVPDSYYYLDGNITKTFTKDGLVINGKIKYKWDAQVQYYYVGQAGGGGQKIQTIKCYPINEASQFFDEPDSSRQGRLGMSIIEHNNINYKCMFLTKLDNTDIKYLFGTSDIDSSSPKSNLSIDSDYYYNNNDFQVDRGNFDGKAIIHLKENFQNFLKNNNFIGNSSDKNISTIKIVNVTGGGGGGFSTHNSYKQEYKWGSTTVFEILWIKKYHSWNSNDYEWVPLIGINKSLKDFVLNYNIEYLYERLGINEETVQSATIYVPQEYKYSQRDYGHSYVYDIISKLPGKDKITIKGGYYNYLVNININSSQINLSGLEINQDKIDNILGIFNNQIIDNCNFLINGDPKFNKIYPNLESGFNIYSAVDASIGNTYSELYKVVNKEEKEIFTDSFRINHESSNEGYYISTGCYLNIKFKNGKECNYPLLTCLYFYSDELENFGIKDTINTQLYPIIMKTTSNANPNDPINNYFGTSNEEYMKIIGLRGDNTLRFDGNELITKLFDIPESYVK